MARRGPPWQAIGLSLLALLIAGALAAAASFASDDQLDARHCIVGKRPDRTLAIVLDVSDPLFAAAPREIASAIREELAHTSKGDHVVVLDMAGSPAAELPTVLDQCNAGDDDNEDRLAVQTAIVKPTLRHLGEISGRPSSTESPIIETFLGIARDPSLHDLGSRLRIFAVTDGLQNSPLQSAYRSGSTFPAPARGALAGVEIRLFIVRNERDIKRQPRAVDRLVQWLTQSGARVAMNEPGWLALLRAQRQAKRS